MRDLLVLDNAAVHARGGGRAAGGAAVRAALACVPYTDKSIYTLHTYENICVYRFIYIRDTPRRARRTRRRGCGSCTVSPPQPWHWTRPRSVSVRRSPCGSSWRWTSVAPRAAAWRRSSACWRSRSRRDGSTVCARLRGCGYFRFDAELARLGLLLFTRCIPSDKMKILYSYVPVILFAILAKATELRFANVHAEQSVPDSVSAVALKAASTGSVQAEKSWWVGKLPNTKYQGNTNTNTNTKYTCDTGQTRNKLLELWVHLTNHTAGHSRPGTTHQTA